MNYIISTENLCKQYKETTALNHVSLHIPQGSIYGLIGNSGNLKYQLTISGYSKKEIKKKITELLSLVHLKDSKKRIMNYSLGMKQRLALAMALVGNPDFLILDEPLNGLDPEGIKDMRAILLDLNHRLDVTILISSHLLGELQKVATDYGFIKNGTLIREFSSSDIENDDLEAFYFQNILS